MKKRKLKVITKYKKLKHGSVVRIRKQGNVTYYDVDPFTSMKGKKKQRLLK